ncbi:MAG: ABC transporter substrate-binding protein [Acidobacteria bacterium]|nr:ABC transporter substrate-binding protein [Acidobacteriota bacterium]
MESSVHKVTVAHSPDADDAFMFYGLATGKVRSSLVRFEHQLDDIQSLNDAAKEGRYEMTAISYHAYPYVADKYILTSPGSSVGDGYGPLVVSKRAMSPDELKGKKVAVPGLQTTAYLALRLYQPDFEAVVAPFDQIIERVQNGAVDAGLIIHEGQLMYDRSGLHRALDLGVWWKEQHNLPLPLGANAILRSLSAEIQKECVDCLRASICYALDNRDEALRYAMEFSRGLDVATAERFVGMYVNHHTTDMAPEVLESARKLLAMGFDAGLITKKVELDYV